MEVKATRIQGGMSSLTQLLFPDRIAFTNGRISVTKRKWLGLGRLEEDVAITRVASVRVDSGILNATVIIETLGGATEDLYVEKIPKGKARELADEIRRSMET